MDMEKWKAAVPQLLDGLGQAGPSRAARAIMTTDTFPKLAWSSLSTPEGEVRVLGMAKGSGMIAPNMATMIGVVLCDADVGSLWWHEAVAACADKSFNSVTVDGDTSTNDCVLALANGPPGEDRFARGRQELLSVMLESQALAYMIVQDAWGHQDLRNKSRGRGQRPGELAARAVGHSRWSRRPCR
jgi:glutamate N-acetyltransferase/amino-acid N-acetyltransferase